MALRRRVAFGAGAVHPAQGHPAIGGMRNHALEAALFGQRSAPAAPDQPLTRSGQPLPTARRSGFDGGARPGPVAPVDPLARHNELILQAVAPRRLTRSPGGTWRPLGR